jgi:hypothetical protein
MGNTAAGGESLVSARTLIRKGRRERVETMHSAIPKWSEPSQESSAKAILAKESQGVPKEGSNARDSRKTVRQ